MLPEDSLLPELDPPDLLPLLDFFLWSTSKGSTALELGIFPLPPRASIPTGSDSVLGDEFCPILPDDS